jgi:hypothetical protein
MNDINKELHPKFLEKILDRRNNAGDLVVRGRIILIFVCE